MTCCWTSRLPVPRRREGLGRADVALAFDAVVGLLLAGLWLSAGPALSFGGTLLLLASLLLPFPWLLVGPRGTAPAGEAPIRSGTVFGLHWFAFGRVSCWTFDAAEARELRGRPLPELEGDFSVRIVRVLGGEEISRGWAALVATFRGVAGALVVAFGAFLLGSVPRGADGDALLGGLLCFFMGLPGLVTPAFFAYLVTFGAPLLLGWFWTTRRSRTPAVVEWTGSVVRADEQRFHLDAPNVQIGLTYGALGTVLTLTSSRASLSIEGDHRDLVPLARALRAWRPSEEVDRERALGSLASLREQT